MTAPLRAATAAALLLAPALAPAQGSTPLPMDQVARAVAPGSWRYTSKASVNGQTMDFGTRTLTLEKRGGAGWLLRDQVQNPTANAVDSLFLGGADLANERRTIHAQTLGGNATVVMRFTPDSVTGSVESPGQTIPLRMANKRGALVSDGVLFLALGKLPLQRGWSGGLELLNPQTGGTMPVSLQVTGSETVTVPAGTYDAWVVKGSAGPSSSTFYVAKGGPVVRVVATSPQLGSGQLETVLTK